MLSFREWLRENELNEAKSFKFHIQLRGMDTAERILKDLKIKDAEIHKSHFYSKIMTNDKKQFDVIINCYNDSILKSKNIKLIILGDGEEKKVLNQLVKKLNLINDVLILGFKQNPYKYMKNAKFLVMCSKFEGFLMVLIESLTCGTPLVSYDCPSGPSEIIIPNENGILVEKQNKDEMTKALNEMISNKELYLHCKQNAKNSVERFSLENIGNQWLQLFNELKK